MQDWARAGPEGRAGMAGLARMGAGLAGQGGRRRDVRAPTLKCA